MDTRYEIENIVKTYLDGAGRSGPDNATAVCPFHVKPDGSREKSPSFAINLNNGLYLCHSCGAKGNLFTFFRDLGLDRQEIDLKYRMLIDAASSNVPKPPTPHEVRYVDTNPIDHRVLGLLDYCPKDLLEAGFNLDTMRHFEVGFDRWHYRVTFPIRDLAGQLVAISGRTVIDAEPRYKIYDKEYLAWNLPQRGNWERANVLYNAHRLYANLYHSKTPQDIILVEGFKACMWVHQSGLTNVAALLGHYLSPPQQWLLEALGCTVYFFLDNNWQGWGGALRAGRLLSKSLPVKIMLYPDRLREVETAQPDNCSAEEIWQQKQQATDFYGFVASLN